MALPIVKKVNIYLWARFYYTYYLTMKNPFPKDLNTVSQIIRLSENDICFFLYNSDSSCVSINNNADPHQTLRGPCIKSTG